MDGHILFDRVLQKPLWPAYAALPQSGLLFAQPANSALAKSVGRKTGQQVWHSQGGHRKTVHR